MGQGSLQMKTRGLNQCEEGIGYPRGKLELQMRSQCKEKVIDVKSVYPGDTVRVVERV